MSQPVDQKLDADECMCWLCQRTRTYCDFLFPIAMHCINKSIWSPRVMESSILLLHSFLSRFQIPFCFNSWFSFCFAGFSFSPAVDLGLWVSGQGFRGDPCGGVERHFDWSGGGPVLALWERLHRAQTLVGGLC